MLAIACLLALALGSLRAQNPDEQGPVVSPGSSEPTAPDEISFQTFYDSLASQGSWIQNNDYGYIWQPSVSDANWAPYTVGHWVYTEDGWTWISDEPWGWATYHYGRWVNLDGIGWCWVPGYVWAPAWVSWRYGDGYCGWAPLPPDSMVGVDYSNPGEDAAGFHIGGDCDSYYGIGAGWYNFLPSVYLGEEDYRGYYTNRYNNYRIINRTTNVTNLNATRGGENGAFAGISLGGPSYLQASSQSQTSIERPDLRFTERVGGGAISGNSLAIFAPQVQASQGSHPEQSIQSLGRANVNRGTDISRPLLVTSRLGAAGPTAQEVQRAQFAQAAAPASAHVATRNMQFRSNFNTPFSAMRPTASYRETPPGGTTMGMRTSQTYPAGPGYRPTASGYNGQRAYPSNGVYHSPAGVGVHPGGGAFRSDGR